MSGQNSFKKVSRVGFSAGLILFFCFAARAQEGRSAPSSSPSSSASPSEARALFELVRDLQAQVQSLNSQLVELRNEQERVNTETKDLRQELAEMKSREGAAPTEAAHQYGTSRPADVAAKASPSALQVSSPQAPQDRIDKLQEDQEMMEGKINDEYQTKVESGSKYRLRLSGIVLLNLYENRGIVDSQDLPTVSERKADMQPWVSPGAFGGSLRQSQLRLQAFGPEIAGSHTSADIQLDFGGGFPQYPNGVTMGEVRLRTGTIRLDWANTSVVAGQDQLFFFPLAPTSLATIATPALSYSGNLWAWVPQVRVEHRFVFSDESSIAIQGGILDSLSGDVPATEYGRYPTWGEMSGQPAYAIRTAWSHRLFGQNMTAGIAGYYGRQNWGYSRLVDGWAGMADLSLPLGKRVEFTAAFYRGRAAAGLGGGMGQDVVVDPNLNFNSASTPIRGLDSIGGWGQLKYKVKSNFEINGAFGIDNPYAGELRRFNMFSTINDPYTRNLTPMLNFIYQIRSDILFSTEYRYVKTTELDFRPTSANHINLSLGYIF